VPKQDSKSPKDAEEGRHRHFSAERYIRQGPLNADTVPRFKAYVQPEFGRWSGERAPASWGAPRRLWRPQL